MGFSPETKAVEVPWTTSPQSSGPDSASGDAVGDGEAGDAVGATVVGAEVVGSKVEGSKLVGGRDGGQGSPQNRRRPSIISSLLSVSVAQNALTPRPIRAHSV